LKFVAHPWQKEMAIKMKTKHLFFLILVLWQLLVSGCKDNNPASPEDIDYRQEMRGFVINLKTYAKSYNSNFIIIPQNGQELITDNGEADGIPQTTYLQAIDATGRESMFWGYYNDDEATPQDDKQHLLGLCLLCEQNNIKVLATDYCSSHSKIDNSYQINEQHGFISFAADQRDLNNIPSYPELPHNVNSDDITGISQAKNFLYLINSEHFNTKQDFIAAVSATGYDVIRFIS
jgi:cysteinyl-tRNA synthetase